MNLLAVKNISLCLFSKSRFVGSTSVGWLCAHLLRSLSQLNTAASELPSFPPSTPLRRLPSASLFPFPPLLCFSSPFPSAELDIQLNICSVTRVHVRTRHREVIRMLPSVRDCA